MGRRFERSQGFDDLGAPATAGDPTWAWANHLVRPWDMPGGDFTAAASAVTAVSDDSLTCCWTSPQRLADVETWRADPALNHGWILIGREDQERNAFRFDSREGLRPPRSVLQLSTVPEVGTAAMLVAGISVIGWLARGRRRR